MDHRKEFQWLVLQQLGPDAAKSVDWSAPRLRCIAGDFTRYDEHAVKQIGRNIELLRYRRFGDDLLMIELVHAPKVARITPGTVFALAPPVAEVVDDDRFALRIFERSPRVLPGFRRGYGAHGVTLKWSKLTDWTKTRESSSAPFGKLPDSRRLTGLPPSLAT
jgi:hypothetical protein